MNGAAVISPQYYVPVMGPHLFSAVGRIVVWMQGYKAQVVILHGEDRAE